ncbi:MAG: UDP-N-acetylglucosamine--LPS N-acetylglucosamine transferase, partial [Actinomycetota bacterium]
MRPVTASRPSGPDPVATDGRKVLLVCSGGGHLAQLLRLEAWWKRHDRVWVTFEHAVDSVPAGEQVHVAHSPTTRNIPNLVRNQALAVRVMKAERPDL